MAVLRRGGTGAVAEVAGERIELGVAEDPREGSPP